MEEEIEIAVKCPECQRRVIDKLSNSTGMMEVMLLTKKRLKKQIYDGIVVIIVTLLVSYIGVFIYNLCDNKKAENDMKNIKNEVIVSDTENFETKNDVENYIAWLKIDNSNIDFPVMQSRDNSYYLRRDYTGKYSNSGTPFLDFRDDIDKSNNLIFYGHNMRDGTMFSSLMKYKDLNYSLEHQKIFLTVNGVQTEYSLYAVLKVDADDEWYGYINQTDEKSFNNSIAKVKENSLYKSTDDAMYGDYFLTLSTCEYSRDNGRLQIIVMK